LDVSAGSAAADTRPRPDIQHGRQRVV